MIETTEFTSAIRTALNAMEDKLAALATAKNASRFEPTALKEGNAVHVSIDLETLGTHADSAIVLIGACAFKPLQYGVALTDTFCMNVTFDSARQYRRKIEPGTLEWWFNPDQDRARAVLMSGGYPRRGLDYALRKFVAWFEQRTSGNPSSIGKPLWGEWCDVRQCDSRKLA